MFICEHCGEIFEEPKVIGNDVDRGEECPGCGSDEFDEAVQCEVCGEWISEADACGYGHHICKDCVKERRYDLPLLVKATEDEYTAVEIPDLIMTFFDEDEVKEILLRELQARFDKSSQPWNKFPEIVPDDFVDHHRHAIADAIGEEV